jgi:putative flavoprotein involved in K+ transport
VRFASDLGESVAWGDERYRQFSDLVRGLVAERGLDEPLLESPEPFDEDPLTELELSGLGAVLFAGGFRPDYRSWLPWPEAFDEHGFPIHDGGGSTVVPGLYFVGVHFLRKRKSSLLVGVGEDAALVAGRISEAHGQRRQSPP